MSTALSQDAPEFGAASAIRILRERRGNVSARALSLACGLSESYVGKLEAGTIEPSLRAFAKLAKELRMTQREVAAVLAAEAVRL